jgi:4-hydroxythreonine-4-phosphate dehydrogenase
MVKPLIAVTIGDFNGIGPEVALKAIQSPAVRRACIPVLVGPLAVIEDATRRFKITATFEKTTLSVVPRRSIPVIDVGDAIAADVVHGAPTKSSGRNAGVSLERAVEACVQRRVAAIVTAPVSKEGLAMAGYGFPGQTEMVALLSGSQRVVMFLLSPHMRIGLVTVHSALATVAPLLTTEKIQEKITIVHESLKTDFRITKPRIAVLGLNPHAGENGLIGREEAEIITPALVAIRALGINAEGPFAADGFFGTHAYRSYDAVVAMYHDQGLIPLKMLGFDAGVNFSAGLSVVRTSPDHGTAYEIAGKNKAKSGSMVEAIMTAVRIAHNRQRA